MGGWNKFVSLKTRLCIVDFSWTESRRYCIKWKSEGNCWGEWPSGLRHCSKNRKVPNSNPIRCYAGLRDQPCYEAPADLQVENLKHWLTSGEWSLKSWLCGKQLLTFFFLLYTGVAPPIYVPTTSFKLIMLRNIRVDEAFLSKGTIVAMKQTSRPI